MAQMWLRFMASPMCFMPTGIWTSCRSLRILPADPLPQSICTFAAGEGDNTELESGRLAQRAVVAWESTFPSQGSWKFGPALRTAASGGNVQGNLPLRTPQRGKRQIRGNPD